jgi:hypothetical protein
VAAAVRAPAQVPSPRSRPEWPSAPRRRGTSAQPVERTSNVQCPVFRCPDGQACAVRGTAAARSASRWTWSGWVGGPPAGRSRSRCPGVRGRWSPASGLTGSDGAAVGRARLPRGRPSPRADAWPASRLRRRLAAGPTRAGPGPGCRPGGEPGTQLVLTGPPAGRLGGRRRGARPWAWTKRWWPRCVVVALGVVRWRPALEGPPGSARSRLRPQRGRGMWEALHARC